MENSIASKKRFIALSSIALIIAGIFAYENILAKREHTAKALTSTDEKNMPAPDTGLETADPTTEFIPPIEETPQTNTATASQPTKSTSKIQTKTALSPVVKQKKNKHKSKKHHSESKQLNTVPIDTPADESLVFKLVIDTGKDKYSFDEKIKKGSSAFDALKAASAIEKFKLDYSTSEWGAFVNSIYGIKPEGAFYWMFKVNGKLSEVGASSYEVKADDTIEWIYMDTSGIF